MTVRREVGDFVSGLPMEYIQCRDVGHSWMPLRAQWVADERCYLRDLECTSCQTVKSQWLNQQGHIISKGGYHYPDGYLHKGTGAFTSVERDSVRLAALNRLLGDTGVRRK